MKSKYSMTRRRQFNFEVSTVCGYFRRHVLKMTFKEFSKLTGVPISTLSTFESGRSSNLKFIYVYLVSCETPQQKNIFIDSIDSVLNRGFYYDKH